MRKKVSDHKEVEGSIEGKNNKNNPEIPEDKYKYLRELHANSGETDEERRKSLKSRGI